MKKSMFLLLVLFTGCKCVLSQIPPQTIYAGAGCEASLPNYVPRVTVLDNCAINSIIQAPLPGFLLTATNPIATVFIRAADISNNIAEISFTVTLLDTIPPIINWDTLSSDATWNIIDRFYNMADLMVLDKMEEFDATFPYEFYNIPENDRDSTYYKNTMIIWTPPAYAKNKMGRRVITFVPDSLILQIY